MKILAFEASSLVASVALAQDDIIISEYTVNHKKTHSQTLMGMLDEIVQMTETDLSEIDAIALTSGPGSFTGLRIGSATAKGLAMALSKPIVAVPTIDAMAVNLWGCEDIICPIMDARRRQVYTGLYTFEEGSLLTLMKQEPLSIEELAERVNKVGSDHSKRVIFLGDGVPVFKEDLKNLIRVPYLLAPANMNRQRAASVAHLAGDYFKKGMYIKAEEHAPDYLRMSQAEREKKEREESKA